MTAPIEPRFRTGTGRSLDTGPGRQHRNPVDLCATVTEVRPAVRYGE
jgi:hypothetical protein